MTADHQRYTVAALLQAIEEFLYKKNELYDAILYDNVLARARELASREAGSHDAQFEKAWYEISNLLIGNYAQAVSPKEVHEKQVMPRLRSLLGRDKLAGLGWNRAQRTRVPVERHPANRWTAEDFDDMAKRMRTLSDEGHSLADDWVDMAEQAADDLRAAELFCEIKNLNNVLGKLIAWIPGLGHVAQKELLEELNPANLSRESRLVLERAETE
jgi:hypothetical protein